MQQPTTIAANQQHQFQHHQAANICNTKQRTPAQQSSSHLHHQAADQHQHFLLHATVPQSMSNNLLRLSSALWGHINIHPRLTKDWINQDTNQPLQPMCPHIWLYPVMPIMSTVSPCSYTYNLYKVTKSSWSSKHIITKKWLLQSLHIHTALTFNTAETIQTLYSNSTSMQTLRYDSLNKDQTFLILSTCLCHSSSPLLIKLHI